MTELKGEGDVFGDGPGGADIGAVEETLLEIVNDVGGDEEGRVAEVTCGVESREGLVELGRSEEDVGVDIGGDFREEG